MSGCGLQGWEKQEKLHKRSILEKKQGRKPVPRRKSEIRVLKRRKPFVILTRKPMENSPGNGQSTENRQTQGICAKPSLTNVRRRSIILYYYSLSMNIIHSEDVYYE